MERAYNVHNGLQHRKRFKCPICGQQMLAIENELHYNCINKCILTRKQINSILEKNDYQGYFTTEQMEKSFGYDYSYKPRVNFKNLKNSFYTENELLKLDQISFNTKIFNNLLDDISIYYFSIYPERESTKRELNHFEYLMNLIEDINVSLNRISKDFMLIDIAYQARNSVKSQNMMFSINYYYFNLSQHFYECNERIILCLGILFHITFHTEAKKNNKSYIIKELKKNDLYKKSDIKKQMTKIMSNHMYNFLTEWRASSTHDVSKYLNDFKDNNVDITKNRAEIDKKLYHSKIKDIIDIISLQNILFEMIISQLNQYFNIQFDTNAIKMIQETGMLKALDVDPNIINENILEEEYLKNEQRLNKLVEKSMYDNSNIIIIHDVVFRMFEIIKSYYYAMRINDSNFRKDWEMQELGFVLDSMDKQYLTYSCAIMIFACYDKLARYLSTRYSLHHEKKTIYFDTFLENVVLDDNILLLLCSDIQNNKVYQFLTSYRNQYVHIIRKGAIYTNTMENFEDYLLLAILYNIQILSDLIDKIL